MTWFTPPSGNYATPPSGNYATVPSENYHTVPLCGPLDIIPNATLAYSMRATSQTYRGPLFNLVAYYDSRVIGDVYAEIDGEPKRDFIQYVNYGSTWAGCVYKWYDQSGNANHAYAVTADKTLVPWVINGGAFTTPWSKLAAFLNGSSDWRLATASGYPNISQPFTIIIVAKLDPLIWIENAHLTDGVGAGSRAMMTCSTDSGTSFSIYAGTGTLSYTPGSTTDSHVYAAVFNGANSYGYIDGAQVISGNPGSGGFNNQYIGGGYGANGSIRGYIGEYLLYPGALTAGQISTITNNQRAYFGF